MKDVKNNFVFIFRRFDPTLYVNRSKIPSVILHQCHDFILPPTELTSTLKVLRHLVASNTWGRITIREGKCVKVFSLAHRKPRKWSLDATTQCYCRPIRNKQLEFCCQVVTEMPGIVGITENWIQTEGVISKANLSYRYITSTEKTLLGWEEISLSLC